MLVDLVSRRGLIGTNSLQNRMLRLDVPDKLLVFADEVIE
jgi:hypothetical protein